MYPTVNWTVYLTLTRDTIALYVSGEWGFYWNPDLFTNHCNVTERDFTSAGTDLREIHVTRTHYGNRLLFVRTNRIPMLDQCIASLWLSSGFSKRLVATIYRFTWKTQRCFPRCWTERFIFSKFLLQSARESFLNLSFAAGCADNFIVIPGYIGFTKRFVFSII